MQTRRQVLSLAASAIAAAGLAGTARAQSGAAGPEKVLRTWFKLVLELVRHTPTYTPPVASRSFGYLGVTAYEAAATSGAGLISLTGQLNGFTSVPARETGAAYDEAHVMHGAMTFAVRTFFFNTGPTGQRSMDAMERKLGEMIAGDVPADVAARSTAYGIAVAQAVIDWSLTDGGAVIENMGFPMSYDLGEGPEKWVPTSVIVQQQTPLLPEWGSNRPFAMPDGGACPLPAPIAYSEEPDSEFYKQAMEVVDVKKNLTPDQRTIARFWSDDPMLSPTPPGHWVYIALDLLDQENADAARSAEVLALLGIAVADGFIGCWHEKFVYDWIRPVSYIKRVIDPKWEPVLITPPFPEYPSGHSTQSGAAIVVLERLFGADFAFTDRTHEDDGIAPRDFPSFAAAADEAALSRLYGGIHFREAIVRGVDQGRCIGAYAAALRTRG
jgi:PAP2 superfamily